MIDVQHVTKRYGPLTAINDVSFRVEPGQILGLLGPNGAGKTTTMRILTGYMPPTEGKVFVAGYDVFERPIDSKRRTGYLPESPPLYPDMTVREYLTFVARINGFRGAKRTKSVDSSMARTSIDDMADMHCAKLSKGYRQRVGLAQAILHNPDVLIFDEPTAGLDPKQIIETRELIKELGGDHTIILSTHILPEVAQTCQTVVIINKGRIVAKDTPDNLTERLRGSEAIRLKIDALGTNPTPVLNSVRGVTSVTPEHFGNDQTDFEIQSAKGIDVRRELAQIIVSRGWGLLEMRQIQMSLEDIFLQLTTEESDDEAAVKIDPAEEVHEA